MCVCVQETGGRPVSHYVVEKKDKKSGVWSPVSRFSRSPSLDVTGLDDGEQYEFRVSAVNDLGQSEPLVTDKPITAKYQFGACHAASRHVLSPVHTARRDSTRPSSCVASASGGVNCSVRVTASRRVLRSVHTDCGVLRCVAVPCDAARRIHTICVVLQCTDNFTS